jgi:hypothetical protein
MLRASHAGKMLSGTNISAFSRSKLPHETIVAYLATDYRISGNWPLVLRIGQRSKELATLYQKYEEASAAVLTAWNPCSERLSDAENEATQSALISKINQLTLRHQPGHGVDPTGKWPSEPSQLVLGLDLQAADSLSREFRQNGFVWVAASAVPALVILR